MVDYKSILKDKEQRLKILNALKFIPDSLMIKLQFQLVMKEKLNLKNPKTFNEKLNWLKLYDHNSRHIQMVDKYRVRKYVQKLVGKEYLIPLIGKWDSYNDIDFSKLPEKFVMKCNHDSGSIQIINNKEKINHKEMSDFFKDRLKNNPYTYGREWPYKYVKPCIVVEKYMCDSEGQAPVDYKFFCFNGYVDSVMICTGRGTTEKRFYFFSKEWKLRKYNRSTQNLPDDFTIDKPKGIDKLFDLAAKLSVGEAFVRVDFYLIDGHPYFGEFTYYPASGLDYNLVSWADQYLGDLINLEIIKGRKK